jgi:flavin reductase (DIM6/NTAB) family NADH-FMN oxidoreductase RutF/DNA-binding IclR family transcriptional regulator
MSDSTSAAGAASRTAEDPAWFRYVLGQCPTSVALITAKGVDGDHVGMVVGTFTSVSLSPPLVGFMPDRKSSSWPKIREAGSFCASICTASQEYVVRAFARKQEDRFTTSSWAETNSGNLRLDGAAAWVDCTIDAVLPAGDHDIVLGKVTELAVGETDDLPLLFLRGGYGSFSIPSIQSLDAFLPKHTRAVDAARPEIELLAEDLKLECVVLVAVEDTVVLVSDAGPQYSGRPGSPSRIGVAFPLAAPFIPVLVAWSGETAERRWLATAARHGNLSVDPDIARAELRAVRAQGYSISTGHKAAAEYERRLDESDPDLSLILPVYQDRVRRGVSGLTDARDVTSLHVPVFGADGRSVLSLVLNGFTGDESPHRLQECLTQLMAAAARVTEKIGGSAPAGITSGSSLR